MRLSHRPCTILYICPPCKTSVYGMAYIFSCCEAHVEYVGPDYLSLSKSNLTGLLVTKCDLRLCHPLEEDWWCSFVSLLSRHGVSTRKRQHLFPVWFILLSGCSYLLQHYSHGSNTEKERWSRNTPRVITDRGYYIPRGVINVRLHFNNFSGDGSAI